MGLIPRYCNHFPTVEIVVVFVADVPKHLPPMRLLETGPCWKSREISSTFTLQRNASFGQRNSVLFTRDAFESAISTIYMIRNKRNKFSALFNFDRAKIMVLSGCYSLIVAYHLFFDRYPSLVTVINLR
jgi:hypothetical protein